MKKAAERNRVSNVGYWSRDDFCWAWPSQNRWHFDLFTILKYWKVGVKPPSLFWFLGLYWALPFEKSGSKNKCGFNSMPLIRYRVSVNLDLKAEDMIIAACHLLAKR